MPKQMQQKPIDVFLIGNPNVGKSTLFNSLTHSHEHTGNFHGVTVSEAKKCVDFYGQNYCFYDLPGLYSLNTFSREEEVSRDFILSGSGLRLVVVDANSLRRNLYLCLQMKELNLDFKILINNYKYFKRRGSDLNTQELQNSFGVDIEIVDAKKQKISKNLLNLNKNNNKNDIFYENYLKNLKNFIQNIKIKTNLEEKQIIYALNGIYNDLKNEQIATIKQFLPEIIAKRYEFIDIILKNCLKNNSKYAYGENKLDKLFLNPFFAIISFIFLFFCVFYLIFFLIGPQISDLFISFLNLILINPFINFLTSVTDNVWLIEFFSSGVFSAFTTILGFLPQICLMYVVLTILEDSGLVARLCYVIDDFLAPFGLNGKIVYIMLMGLGCNTLATLTTRNIKGKNLKTKAALINPYISCMARLPVYSVVAAALFGVKAFWFVAGIYVLGFVVSLVLALILNKTILPTEKGELLLEFPPLKHIDIKHCLQTIVTSAVDMFKRLFGVVLAVGVIVWVLTHTMFNLRYTQDITSSIAFILASKISFIFVPIGLNSAGVVCALFVGILAKELVVSTFSICNNVATRTELIKSLTMFASVISFSPASAVSFLIFSLLYCPCASNLAVLKAETDKFYMWFAILSQFTIAYMLSFVVYQILIKRFLFALLIFVSIIILMFSVMYFAKKIRRPKCLACAGCKK